MRQRIVSAKVLGKGQKLVLSQPIEVSPSFQLRDGGFGVAFQSSRIDQAHHLLANEIVGATDDPVEALKLALERVTKDPSHENQLILGAVVSSVGASGQGKVLGEFLTKDKVQDFMARVKKSV